MNRSKIWSKEFETATKTTWYNWNPVRGCTKYKNGCPVPDCWAAKFCKRLAGIYKAYGKSQSAWIKKTGKNLIDDLRNFRPIRLDSELLKNFPIKQSFILTCWQAELSTVPKEWIQEILDKIHRNNLTRSHKGKPLHYFFFLTKWPEFYRKFHWPANCWLGATFTSDLDYRMQMPHLSKAGDRNPTFAMIEPYLKQIEKNNINEMVTGEYDQVLDDGKMKYTEINPVSWVVVGGGSTPLNPDWVRSIRDQCKAAEILFHFKGWGRQYPYWCPNEKIYKYEKSKKRIGQVIDGELHLEGPGKK